MKREQFIIEVPNKIDAKYIQEKAIDAGYRRHSDMPLFENDSLKYLLFNSFVKGEISWGEDIVNISDRPLYKFPSQAEEIVKLFEKEKEPEFKEGEYYRYSELAKKELCQEEHPEVYQGKCYKIKEINKINSYLTHLISECGDRTSMEWAQKATPSEIFESIKKDLQHV